MSEFTIVEGDVTLRSAGVELATDDGVAIVAGARGFIGVGYDGTNTRFLRVDTSGYQIAVGAGTAGTPAGGVLSVQGVSGGQALPVSATALPLPSGAATEATLSAAEVTLDRIADTDGIKKITDPLPAGTNNIGDVDVVSSALPTGAATEATLATLLTETTFTTRVPVLALGGGIESGALRVTIASDSTGVVSVDDNGGSLTVDTPQLPGSLVGDRLDSNVGAWMGATTPTVGQKVMAASLPVVVASDQGPILRGLVSTNNSSTATLGSSGVFTGTADEVTDYAMAYVTVYSDVASATDGLSVQQSHDGTNWDHTDEFTVDAASGKTFSFQCAAKFFRVVYTNGATAQSAFRLQTTYKQAYGKPSSHRIQDAITTDDDAELVKSVIAGQDVTGAFQNIVSTTDGRLNVAIAAAPATSAVQDQLLNGGSDDLIVDGSGTPVEFTFSADPTDDIVLDDLRLVITGGILDFDGVTFGKGGGSLANGVLVDAQVNNGTSITITTLMVNEHFLRLSNVLTEYGGSYDAIAGSIPFGGSVRLIAGSSDFVRLTIRDNLTGGVRDLKHFTATIYGTAL